MSDVADARIVCLCIYYDEHPHWLGQHLASLAPVVTDFVYVDGAYALFPGGREHPASPLDVSTQLHEMAQACSRSVLHYRPSQAFYGNEVEKRNMTLDLARSLPEVAGNPNVWFLVADADTVAIKVNPALPRILAETDKNVAEFAAEAAALRTDNVLEGGRWDVVRRAEMTKPMHVRSIYRNVIGLRYGPAHWHVTWGKPGQERNWLWGGGLRRQEPSLDVTMELRFEHRQMQRDVDRQRSSLRYYEIRDAAGIEFG